MDINTFERFYFIGIGGIGMSALARYFMSQGKAVAGYDRVSRSLTDALQAEGAAIHFEEAPAQIPEAFRNKGTLVVYTPAVPDDHAELCFFRENGFPVIKRAGVLGLLSAKHQTVAVAGTHGKTTISAMLANIFRVAGVNQLAFLGGLANNFEGNLALPHKNASQPPVMVAEADEFDRSFHQLSAGRVVVSAVDADHLDIYGTHEAMMAAFQEFLDKLPTDGLALLNQSVAQILKPSQAQTLSYALVDNTADAYAGNIRVVEGKLYFDYHFPEALQGPVRDIPLQAPSSVNVENAVAALTLAVRAGVQPAALKQGIASFSGIWRRFDVHIQQPHQVYIDDYAHHPVELERTIQSVRELFPGRHITAIFQPHLYTRTRDFAEGFAQSLAQADRVVLLGIYPAREEPIPGVTSSWLLGKIKSKDKHLCTRSELAQLVGNFETDIVLTLGAGNIDELVGNIKEVLSS